MTTNYHIRVELPNQSFKDCTIPAEDRIGAQMRLEEKICRDNKWDFMTTNFDWRGMVVFISFSNPRVNV